MIDFRGWLRHWDDDEENYSLFSLFLATSFLLHVSIVMVILLKGWLNFSFHPKDVYTVTLIGNPFGDDQPGKAGLPFVPPHKEDEKMPKADPNKIPKSLEEALPPLKTEEPKKKKKKKEEAQVPKNPESPMKLPGKPEPKASSAKSVKDRNQKVEDRYKSSWLSGDNTDESDEKGQAPKDGKEWGISGGTGTEELEPGSVFEMGEGKGLGMKTEGSIDLDSMNFPYLYYLAGLRNKISGVWTPKVGYLRGLNTKVVIYFKLNRDGKLQNAEIYQPSGVDLLDQSALRAVRLADPYAPLPPAFKDDTLGIYFTFNLSR